jgi:hypothetical protein
VQKIDGASSAFISTGVIGDETDALAADDVK